MKASCAAVLLLVFACGPAPDEIPDEGAISTSQDGLWISKPDLWTIPTIPVCWLNPNYTWEKEWVRDAIERSWESEIGVAFTGWGDCPPFDWFQPTFAVRIKIMTSGQPHTERLGFATGLEPTSVWLNFGTSPSDAYHCGDYSTPASAK